MGDVARRDARVGRASFGVWLAAIVALGLLIRVVYVYVVLRHVALFPDSVWYLIQAKNVRSGVGYVDVGRQFAGFAGRGVAAGNVDTAYWPPLYTLFLAGVQSIFGEATRTSQLAGIITGAATMTLTGVLGREIAGRTVGLVAAAIVALSPFAIAVDGSLMSETLYVPLVLLALLFAHRARTHTGALYWCLLGGTIGLAALTRQDALFLVVVALIPAGVLSRDPVRHLVPRVAASLGVMVLVLSPWVIRNAVEVGEPAISTVSASGVVAGANCPATYGGKALGYWVYSCMHPELGFRMSETDYTARLRRDGLDFAFGHAQDWPKVVAARLGRVWGVWDPRDLTRREAEETRQRHWQELAWVVSISTLLLGLAGLRVLAKQKKPIAVLVGPIVMTTLVAIATYGNTRFRAATEPVLAIAAAAAILAIGAWVSGRSARSPEPDRAPAVEAAQV